MEKNGRFIICTVLFVTSFVLCGLIAGNTASSQDYQKVPIIMKASEVLRQQWLKGPNYTIKETVTSDGVVSTYELDTNYGPVTIGKHMFFC